MIYLKPEQAIEAANKKLYAYGKEIQQKTWQSVESPDNTIELLNHNFTVVMPEGKKVMQESIKPNLPWADLHFDERVSGIPLNPPPSHEIWPFAHNKNENFMPNKKFSHTYPERFWPVYAGKWEDLKCYGPSETPSNEGIRYAYGDLRGVINLLGQDITTRQAYLPIFFPEDTGNRMNVRIPCTLGYHFIVRENLLHLNYYMRSCDIVRHFQDDMYLAMRLASWVADELSINYHIDTGLGTLSMYITSLHCFKSDILYIKKKYGIKV